MEAPVTRRISLLRYAPAMLLLLIVVADSAQFPDPDLWGHLRFGQAALASGHVIARDTYSYSVAGGLWRNHEWLSEIVMAIAYNCFGVIGLKLWKFACVAATITLMALGLAETGASPAIQLNTLGLAALATVLQNQFRPQLFTFVLLAATLVLLARDNYRGHALLWLAVPIMMLWGNLHGGFIIGVATLATYTGAIGVQDLMAGRGFARVLRLGLITVAATLATLVSPYGIDAWLVVLNALKHYAAQPIIADWDPLLYVIREQWQLKHVSVIFLVAGIVIIGAFAITFIATPHGDDMPLAIIAAIMSIAAFTAVRNMPLAVIACAPPFARHAELIAARRRNRKLARGPADTPPAAVTSHETSRDRPRVGQWLVGSIAIALAAVAGLFSSHLPVDATDYPIGAVAFICQHDLHGNILADFAQGENLIWHLAPASKVFIDGRYDTVYPQKVIDQYLDFMAGRPDAPFVLQAYPHDFVLVPRNGLALGVMRNAAQWKLIYRDQDSVLFARADSAAAKIPGIPIDGNPPRESSFP
jgi:hypothetical protein